MTCHSILFVRHYHFDNKTKKGIIVYLPFYCVTHCTYSLAGSRRPLIPSLSPCPQRHVRGESSSSGQGKAQGYPDYNSDKQAKWRDGMRCRSTSMHLSWASTAKALEKVPHFSPRTIGLYHARRHGSISRSFCTWYAQPFFLRSSPLSPGDILMAS